MSASQKAPPGVAAMPQAPAPSPGPAVTITLGPRHGHATPCRKGCTHTGGGNIDVAQPSPDTVVVTMTGVAVATGAPGCPGVASMEFDLDQCLEIAFDNPDVKAAKLTIEGRVIGLLRSHCCCKKGGYVEESGGCATVCIGETALLTLCVPPHSVAMGENLSINDREGPCTVPVLPGKFHLHQTWHLSAQHPQCVLPCKAASVEFAPDPALDPIWISYWEPFHGAAKKDFGFQIAIKVAPDPTVGREQAKPEPGKEKGMP